VQSVRPAELHSAQAEETAENISAGCTGNMPMFQAGSATAGCKIASVLFALIDSRGWHAILDSPHVNHDADPIEHGDAETKSGGCESGQE
jgi:hypothetical protein